MPRKNRLQVDLDQPTQDDPQQHTAAQSERRFATINLTVTPPERRAWKEWCARHDKKHNEAWREAFELLKEKYGR